MEFGRFLQKDNKRTLKKLSVKSTIAAMTAAVSCFPTPSTEGNRSGAASDSSVLASIPDREDFDLSTLKYPLQKNGKVVTPYGDLPIEGLRIKVNPSKLSVPDDQIIKISTIEKDFDYREKKLEWKMGKFAVVYPSKSTNKEIIEKIEKENPLNIGKYEVFITYGNSPLYESGTYLSTSGSRDGAVVIDAFNKDSGKKLSTNIYEEKFSNRCNDKVFLVQELPTPKTAPTVCDTADLFKPYLKKEIGLVSFSIRKRKDYYIDGHWDVDDSVARVSLPEYRKKGKYETNALVRFHELSHAAYSSMDADAHKSLDLAYARLKSTVESGMSKAEMDRKNKEDVMKSEPIWALLTESTYLRKVGIDDPRPGHPNDNVRETQASTLTVLRTFPDLFIDHYPKLSSSDRQAVTYAITNVVKSMQSINSDKATMNELLPELPSVLKVLADDSANSKDAAKLNALLKSVT